MVEGGLSAISASFEVGHESVFQFTRDYRRMFPAPPKQDSLRRRLALGNAHDGGTLRVIL
jgi:hypothetical protein